MAPDLADQRGDFGPRRVQIEYVGREGVFGPDRFSLPIRLDGMIIDPAGDPIVPAAGFPKMLLEKVSGFAFRSAPVKIPSRSILAAVAGPTPWNFLIVSAWTKAGPVRGVITA